MVGGVAREGQGTRSGEQRRGRRLEPFLCGLMKLKAQQAVNVSTSSPYCTPPPTAPSPCTLTSSPTHPLCAGQQQQSPGYSSGHMFKLPYVGPAPLTKESYQKHSSAAPDHNIVLKYVCSWKVFIVSYPGHTVMTDPNPPPPPKAEVLGSFPRPEEIVPISEGILAGLENICLFHSRWKNSPSSPSVSAWSGKRLKVKDNKDKDKSGNLIENLLILNNPVEYEEVNMNY